MASFLYTFCLPVGWALAAALAAAAPRQAAHYGGALTLVLLSRLAVQLFREPAKGVQRAGRGPVACTPSSAGSGAVQGRGTPYSFS